MAQPFLAVLFDQLAPRPEGSGVTTTATLACLRQAGKNQDRKDGPRADAF